jgi:hypothetical protein
VEAHGLLHTAAILEGHAMIWPDPQLSKRGRWWQKLREMWSPRRFDTPPRSLPL